MALETLSPIHPRNPGNNLNEKNKRAPEQKVKKKEEVETLNEEVPRESFSYSEGMGYVYLPSKGYFYPGKFKGVDRLKVKPIDWREEDILTTPTFFEDGSIFLELLKSTIIDENGFPASQLVPVDRDTILIWLRSTAFGNNFEIDFTCPVCQNKKSKKPGIISWDLSSLEIPQYTEEISEILEAEGEYRVELPLSRVCVRIVTPNLGKLADLEKRFNLKNEAQGSKKASYGTSTLLSVVNGVEVDDKVIRAKDDIAKYFDKITLPIVDSRFILREAAKLNLQYKTAKTFECHDCKHVEEGVELPILHKNFFWPES